MQVNSISSANSVAQTAFQSARDTQLEQFAALDDKAIRKLAYKKASHDVNDKKHKRITNALYYSIPLAAGVAAAIRNPGLIGSAIKGAKNVDLSRYGRLNNFVSTTLGWATAFLTIDAVFGAKRYADKKIPDMKEFSQKHPVLSSLGTIGVGIAALFGVNKGLSKLATKALKKVPEKEITKSVVDVAKKLNNSKMLNSISKQLKKVPASIKAFTAGVMDYAPLLLIISSITHSFSHDKVKTVEYQKNYNNLKTAQAMVRAEIAAKDEAGEIDE